LGSEDNEEDFPVLEADVLGSLFEEDIEDFTVVGTLVSAPDESIVSGLKEEQQSPTSQLVDHGRSPPIYDSYKSYSELDMMDFQEQTVEPYPLFTKEKYHKKISHPSPLEDVEKNEKEQSFSMGPIYHYEFDPWESQEEEPEEQEEWFALCPEPVSKQSLPEIRKPTSIIHPLVLNRDIQPL
jgi:hypothetical protein